MGSYHISNPPIGVDRDPKEAALQEMVERLKTWRDEAAEEHRALTEQHLTLSHKRERARDRIEQFDNALAALKVVQQRGLGPR